MDTTLQDPPVGSAGHNAYPIAFDTQGSTSTKRFSEDIVDVARPTKVPRLTETSTFLMLNELIELTQYAVSVVIQAKAKS